MPNPFSKIIPNAELYLDANVLDSKPEMSAATACIFANSAIIERELRYLLLTFLGTNFRSAVAIYDMLNTQSLQLKALDAAAQSTLAQQDYKLFLAGISVAASTKTPRDHLAHWLWGGCKQRPDLLALADPKMIKANDIREATFYAQPNRMWDIDGWDPDWLDPDYVVAYSIDDLNRAVRDLEEAVHTLGLLGSYFNLSIRYRIEGKPEPIQGVFYPEPDQLLDQLNKQRIFREALDQMQRDSQKTIPPMIGGSPPPDRYG